MAKCAHFEVCGIEDDAIPEGGHCILHAQDPSKDRKQFAEALEGHLATGASDFRWMYFCDTVDFEGRAFEQADFFEATFNKSVNFSGATFNGWANLYRAIFNGEAVFYRAAFEYGNFLRATFRARVYFSGATFNGLADFSKTVFNKRANFSGATFNERADFCRSTFEQADFSGPMLEEVIIEATFELPVFSLGATFNKRANFSGATFNELADFSRTVFNEEVALEHCVFRRKALFEGSGQHMLFSGAEVDFRDVTLDPLAPIAFRNADLRRCRFLNTDVRKIEFTSVKWCRKPTRWPGRGTVCAYDELIYKDDFKKEWGRLERLYRELKQNHEDRKDYARAGDFHFREKEMRRQNDATPPSHRFLLRLYWALSGYGERIWPAVAWFLAIVFGCAALYLGFGIAPAGYGGALLYSAQTSFLIQPDGYELKIGVQWIRLVQTVVSPILLGLIALAIRQRLKR